MRPSDDHLRQLLDELGRALAEAIAASSDVAGVAARIRRNGFSLNLILNCAKGDVAGQSTEPLVPAPILRGTPEFESLAASSQRSDPRAAAPAPRQPAFRLNAHDVGFLKALGIDGTRPARR